MSFCVQTAEMLRIIGWVLTIFKIGIPIIIIALGMLDFGKAVISSEEDEIKKQAKTLGRRAVAGLAIFFIPTLVLWIFEELTPYSTIADEADFNVCKVCILRPWNTTDCKNPNNDPSIDKP